MTNIPKRVVISIFLLAFALNECLAACRSFNDPQNLNLQIEGFCVILTDKALPKNDPVHDEFIKHLKKQIENTRTLSPKLFELKNQTTIWVTNSDWQTSAATTHFSKEWLIEHKMNPEMAVGIEIVNTKNFVKWNVPEDQPLMLLHELAHIYNFLNEVKYQKEIDEAFLNAKKLKLYDFVDYQRRGVKMPAYALQNAREYFAESTEAYYGGNDYFPYTKADLKRHDPKMYELLSKIFP